MNLQAHEIEQSINATLECLEELGSIIEEATARTKQVLINAAADQTGTCIKLAERLAGAAQGLAADVQAEAADLIVFANRLQTPEQIARVKSKALDLVRYTAADAQEARIVVQAARDSQHLKN